MACPFILRRQLDRYALPAILLLAAALRLYRLGAANLWWDEALAIWAVRKGLLDVTLWTASDVHPPLYFWSLWGWVRLVGESEFAMRALSALFGVFTVAVVYRLGALVSGRAVGNLAALLTALARFHVWWSQEMRMYVLAGLAGTASLYFFLRWLRLQQVQGEQAAEGRSATAALAGYAIASIAALYTVLLMGALLLVQNLVVLLCLVWPGRARRGRLLVRWVLAQLVIAGALALWLALSWGRMRSWSVAGSVGLRFFLRLYATLLTTGVSVGIERLVWPVVLPFAILLVGAWLLIRKLRQAPSARWVSAVNALTLTLAIALPVLVVYAATLPRSFFYTPHVEARYFLPFAPAFWVLLAWSVALIGRRWPAAGLAAGAALVGLWLAFLPGHYADRYQHDTLQTMVRTIVSQAEAGDAVMLDSGGRYPIFAYYYERLAQKDGQLPPMVTVSRSEDPLAPEQVERALEALAAEHERVWLAEVDVHLTDPERLVAQGLDERYRAVLTRRYGPNTLTLYAADGEAPRLSPPYAPQHRLASPVGDGQLLGWELPVRETDGLGTAYVSLLWERVPGDTVWVGLYDPRGRLLLRRSAPPEDAGHAWRRQQFDLPLGATTPAGTYQVLMSAQGASLPLGTLRIAGTERLPRARALDQALNVRLGDDVTLLGYRLRGERGGRLRTLHPGASVVLDLYWRVGSKLDQDYTVFTHLLGQAHNPRTQGPVWGQHDSQPADGGYPTSQWLVGDTIVDRHTIVLDDGAPEGLYRIEVGMYRVEDGQRLPVYGADGAPLGDHIVLDAALSVAP